MIISQLFSNHSDGREVYLPVYEEFLTDDFVGTARHILEIGVQYGIGLAAWLKCFPAAMVYGLDCSPIDVWKCDVKDNPRLITHTGNSSISEHGEAFFARINNVAMDIIVDDADHQETSQLSTLENFLPHLAPCGVYIIEDTGPRDGDDPFVQKIRSMCGDRKVYARPVSNLAGVIVIGAANDQG